MTRRFPLPRTRTGRRTALGAAATAVVLGAGLAVLLPQDDAPADASVDAPIVELDGTYAGTAAVNALGGTDGKALERVAEAHDRTPQELARSFTSDATLNVDQGGRLYYADDFDGGTQAHGRGHGKPTTTPSPASSTSESTPDPDHDVAPEPQGYRPVGLEELPRGEGTDRGPHSPLSQTFQLHSNPGASRTIYLDFDGFTFPASSYWATMQRKTVGAWDPSGDGPAFNASERAGVQEIWARVAEDFISFDVDVTTLAPEEDTRSTYQSVTSLRGSRVIIADYTYTEHQSGVLDSTLSGGSGTIGLAHLGIFGSSAAWDSPALVFGRGPAFVDADLGAWVVSHEVGHHIDLQHTFDTGNRFGAQPTGTDASALHSRTMDYVNGGPLSVFSQDERLWTRSVGLLERTDEPGTGPGTARPLGKGGVTTGYITFAADEDWYALEGCTEVTARATVADLTPGLDVAIELRDAEGVLLRTAAPDTAVGSRTRNAGVDATLTASLDGSTHYVAVRPSGSAHYPAGHVVGGYTLSVDGCDVEASAPSAPTDLQATTSPTGTTQITWSPPVSTGGLPLLGYDVSLPDSSAVRVPATQTAWSTSTAPDTSVQIKVRAVTAVGSSTASSVASTLRPGVPLHLGVVNHGSQTTVSIVERPHRRATSTQLHIAGVGAYYPLGSLASTSIWPVQESTPWTVGATSRVVLTNSLGSQIAPYTVRSAVTAPAAPSTVTATLHGTAAALAWGLPPDDGGAFASYQVRLDDGAWSLVDGFTFEHLFTELEPGEHTVSVRATHSGGTSEIVTQSVTVTGEPTPPTAVTDVEVEVDPPLSTPAPSDPEAPAAPPAPVQATVTWDPPVSDGQTPVREWMVTLDGQSTSLSPLRRSLTLVGLRSGRHTLTLAPVNDAGTGTPVTRTITVQ